MRYGGLGQNGTAVQESEQRVAVGAVAVKEIPYDYVAAFKLKGEPANRVQDVITISTEGVFVAVSIAYSFIPNSRAFGTPANVPGAEPVADMFAAPAFPAPAADLVRKALATNLLLRASGIQFLYRIVDSGSGRELQNRAIHSLSGLGSAEGDRPFRPFAKPALFQPRSSIRIEIEEISEGALYRDGTLYIVLHGYKRLGE